MEITFQLFLSYTRQDEDRVELLYKQLAEAGYRPWMDTKDLLPGEQWDLSIEKAIEKSSFFLACLSKNSVSKRGFLQKEIRYAIDILKEMRDEDIYLIPVRLEECDVPDSLRNLQWVDLYEKNGLVRLFEAIDTGIRKRVVGQNIEIIQPTVTQPSIDQGKEKEDIGYLRKVLAQSNDCRHRFSQAESLAYGIYGKPTQYVHLPYFTDDVIGHCRKVEGFLNQIIAEPDDQKGRLPGFDPTPEEAMHLLAAVWLNYLGMFYGIFTGERPDDIVSDPERRAELYTQYETRTALHISSEWKINCSWSNVEKDILTLICQARKRQHAIDDIEMTIPGPLTHTPIRLRSLAALLRLADACSIERTWAPGVLQELYNKLHMPPEDVCYWDFPKLITNVQFDHDPHQIKVESICPKPFSFIRGTFNLGEIIDIACQDIKQELNGVQTILLGHRNTAFREVINKKYALGSSAGVSQYCLGAWPYFLHKPCSATESAAALAQMLTFELQETQQHDRAWQRRMLGMIDETFKWRQFDFMIKNLQDEVEIRMPKIVEQTGELKAAAVKDLLNYLQSYLSQIESSCDKMLETARGFIEPNDVLVIYGYSINVARFLESIRPPQHKAPVYVVNCNQPDGDELHFGQHENDRMLTILKDYGYKVYSIGLASLSQVLADLTKKQHRCMILVGTHGILRSGDLLCKAGTHSLVLTGKAYDVPIIAFASTAKAVRNGSPDENTDSGGYVASETSKEVDEKHRVLCTWAMMDKVLIGSVDHLVTEAGVRSNRRSDVPHAPEAALNRAAPGSTAS